ncbi:MAG: RnfABCDGE type electron transport complex subunit D [Gammaproteobacteria bacterium]
MSAVPVIAAPHVHAGTSVRRSMILVMIALVPATAWGITQYGWPALNLLLMTIGAAVAAEAFSLKAANQTVRPVLQDGSALLTGWLLALTLPPWAPWWLGVFGAVFAIVVSKQVFGGLGQNLFNPAMVGRVVLLVAFPLEMTTWVAPHVLFQPASPSFAESLRITFLEAVNTDAITGATALGHESGQPTASEAQNEATSEGFDVRASLLGEQYGSFGEGSAPLLASGGLLLLLTGVIRWPIPVAMVGSLAFVATLFHVLEPARYADAGFHLLSGGLVLGAFFIATDPVTSPVTRPGQLVFGAGCGLLTYTIRTWGGYPEGVAFAVLLMNAATPIIDYYIHPRVFGRTLSGISLKLPDEKPAATVKPWSARAPKGNQQ